MIPGPGYCTHLYVDSVVRSSNCDGVSGDIGFTVPGGLADGSHTYSINAYDPLGNTEGVSNSFVVDTTPPTVPTITSTSHPAAAQWYRTTAAAATFAGSTDANGGVTYRYVVSTDPAATPVSMGTQTSVTVADGITYARAVAVDQAGNVSATATRTLKSDSSDAIGMLENHEYVDFGIAGTAAHVDVASGNLVLETTDVRRVDTGVPFELGRTFNSRATGSGVGGTGTLFDYLDARIDRYGDGTRIVRLTSGAGARFEQTNGQFSAPPGYSATLKLNGDGTETLVEDDTGDSLTFASAADGGYARSFVAADGSGFTVERQGGRAVSLLDTDGKRGSIVYDASGLVSRIDVPAAASTVLSRTATTVSRTAAGLDTATWTLQSGLVTRATAAGKELAFGYDAQRRVTSVGGASGTTTFTYPVPSTTVVTAPDGTRTEWVTDANLQPRRRMVGAAPPGQVNLGGTLVSSAGAPLAADASYALTASAASGESLDVVVDGGTEDQKPGSSGSFTFETAGRAPGGTLVAVTATRSGGSATSWIPVVLARTEDPPPSGSAAIDAEPAFALDSAIRLRQDLGLRRDTPYVQALLNDPTRVVSLRRFGTPLTDAEYVDIAGRSALQGALEIVDGFAAEIGDGVFAGGYLDQAAGGILRIGFTQNSAANLAALKATFPYPDKVQSFDAARSWQQLVDLQAAIKGDSQLLALQGVDLTATSIDPRANLVVIGSAAQPSTAQELYVSTRYGGGARLEQNPGWSGTVDEPVGPPYRNRKWRPLVAGSSWGPKSGPNCTLAFGTSRSLQNGRTAYFTLSAAHCQPTGTVAYQGGTGELPAGSKIGKVSQKPAVIDRQSYDAELIAVPRRLVVAAKTGRVYPRIHQDSNTIRFIDGVFRSKFTISETMVCQSGSNWERAQCGVVDQLNASYQLPGFEAIGLVRCKCPVRGGDSGGPVTIDSGDRPVRAAGVTSGGVGDSVTPGGKDYHPKTLFTPIRSVEDVLNVTVLVRKAK